MDVNHQVHINSKVCDMGPFSFCYSTHTQLDTAFCNFSRTCMVLRFLGDSPPLYHVYMVGLIDVENSWKFANVHGVPAANLEWSKSRCVVLPKRIALIDKELPFYNVMSCNIEKPPHGCALALAKGNLWLNSAPMVQHNCHGMTIPTHPGMSKIFRVGGCTATSRRLHLVLTMSKTSI